jgi:O-antigen ligase
MMGAVRHQGPDMTWPVSAPASVARRPTVKWTELYLGLLGFSLAGYALLGKTFGYIGIPPFFIGELVLLLGILAFLKANRTFAALASWPALLLLPTMAWVVIRTIPFIGEYGLNALRDSVIIIYGVLAFVVIALMLEDAKRIERVLNAYRGFIVAFVFIMPIVGTIAAFSQHELPQMPGTGLPILSLRFGDLAVHLSGAAVFTLAGLWRPPVIWMLFMLWGMALVGTQNRGAVLALVVPIFIATIASGRLRALMSILAPVAILFAAGYAMNIDVQISDDGRRMFGPRQLVDNVLSIFGSTTEELDGTKAWRLEWWQSIYNYTIHGQHFWSGKGFGVNLAVSDGFVVGTENPNAPPLRSPHNASLTILARSGVPGLLLWVILLGSWFATLVDAILLARRRRQREWYGVLLFVTCYLLAALINSSFDVALEGPMLGFWFWSLFGFGIAAVMVYRMQPPPGAALPAEYRSDNFGEPR